MIAARRLESALGITAAVLTGFGCVIAWFLPVTTSVSRAIFNGRALPPVYHSTSLAQQVGIPRALAIEATFVILGVWMLLALIAHARQSSGYSLATAWAGVLLLSAASDIATVIVAYLFWPAAIVALLAALVASLAHYVDRRPLSPVHSA